MYRVTESKGWGDLAAMHHKTEVVYEAQSTGMSKGHM